jgi:plastocyanin
VAIGDGPDGVPPSQWPVSGWPEPDAASEGPDGSPAPVDLGVVFYSDGGFVNTGPLPQGATASVTFQAAGEFQVFCADHPDMIATVTVVDPGTAAVTTQEDADAAAAASRDALLGQADALRESRLANVESFPSSGGTTTWNVFADAATVATDLAGGGVGYLELFEFVPPTLAIAPGDTVHWSAVGVTTVTFPAAGQDPATLDPTAPATAGETFDGTQLASSGLLNADMGSPSAYTLTFPTAGSFAYVSLPHLAFGQQGTVVVGDAASPEASAAP